MWVVELVCVLGIAFLLICLRGFHAALRQKHTVWTVLVNTEHDKVIEFPARKSSPVSCPKAA